METERQQQIEHLYHASLARDTSERAAFLAEACAGDEELHREVELMLSSGFHTERDLEDTAREVNAQTYTEEEAPSIIGQQLGPYLLISRIGAGGMGEVYLAQDTRLRRKIALKILPAKFTADLDRLKRFVQEAQSASSLNHPNIITIYEIGQVNDVHFIATEFIAGQTLRKLITEPNHTIRDALELATQIAGPFAAAHEAGIVHRDIKPENIMVRPDGLAKVLDFGLVKLTESHPTMTDPHPAYADETSTRSGVLMGTPRYMSPEQARGQKVDTRTDIFSLGVVLYEMITGKMPFEGDSMGDVIASVLRSEPHPLSHYLPGVPQELQQIVEKTLHKDRRLRYQTAKDLQLDLKNLKENLEFEDKLAGAHQGQSRDRATVKMNVFSTHEISNAPAVSSVEYLLGVINRHRRGALLTLAALVMIIVGLVFGLRKRAEPFKTINITRLTTAGKAVRSAISPDGKYLVYAKNEAGKQSLWLAQVNLESNTQIVPPAPVDYQGITFSRDGNFIYYVRSEPEGVLYRTPTLGGAVRKLLVKVDSPITLSPDGKQIAFVRFDYPAGMGVLMIAQEDGSNEKRLAARSSENTFRRTGPAWSPDGKIIACAAENYPGSSHSVVGVTVENGAEKTLTPQRWEQVGQVAWLSDGSGLLVVGAERYSNMMQIWHISYPKGAARRVTNDLSSYLNISLTADSGSFTTIKSDRLMNIWVAPAGDASRAVQITTGVQREDGFRGLIWMPDGKIVYRTFADGNANIWIMNSDGTGNTQLSTDANINLDQTITTDGRYIVWMSRQANNRNIWRMELDGRRPKQLTHGEGEWFPQFTPDGKWLVYQSIGNREIHRMLMKVPLDGGAPVQLTDKASWAPVLSPDGKLIAFNYRPQAGVPNQIAVISIDGGPPINTFEVPGANDRPLRWTSDGRALVYPVTKGGVSNLWSQALAGGPPKQLTDFTTLQIFNFAWSPDGRQLALSRSDGYSDVVMISNVR